MRDHDRHKDVEYTVLDDAGRSISFRTLKEAVWSAFLASSSTGKWVNVNVLIYSEAGALWYGGDEARRMYLDDPEASVFDQIKLKAYSEGMLP